MLVRFNKDFGWYSRLTSVLIRIGVFLVSKFTRESGVVLIIEKEDIEMSKKATPNKIYLEEKELPESWINLPGIMEKKPEPLINPGTKEKMTQDELEQVFCKQLVRQELDFTNKRILIPTPVLDYYRMYRPSPVIRAYELEKALGTTAEIYYKFEGNNTSGSHKLNSAVAQAYYAKEQGLEGLTTETGAGQWGTALSMACAHFGLNLEVFMVHLSYNQKPLRKEVMNLYGAKVIPSPSNTTEIGRKFLLEDPSHMGTLGTAISEAVEVALKRTGYRYALGSVLNQVLLHQSIIGLETKMALEKYGIKPDVIIGCAGGGSNLGGLIAPYIEEMITGQEKYEIIAAEPESCPSFTKGKFEFDFCDAGEMCPMAKMYTMGHRYIPSQDHAGGLRYHGMSPILSQLYADQFFSARSVSQETVFQSARLFARTEGIIPAPESGHGISVAIKEALKCKESGEKKIILLGLSGTGYFDLNAYKEKVLG